MEVAANVRGNQEAWQLVSLCERDFPPVLAQFRRNEGKPQLGVDFLLGSAGNAPRSGEQPVFIELPMAPERQAAQGNIVSLGTGEIEQGRTIAFLRHGAHVDLEAGAQHDRGAGRAVRDDFCDVFVALQFLADRRAVRGRGQHVEIADGIATPAIAAGSHDPAAVAQIGEQRLCFRLNHRKLEARWCLWLVECRRQLADDARTEPLQLAQPARLHGAAQIVERMHLQPVVEQLDALRSQPGKRRHVANLAWKLLLERLEKLEMACLDDVGDLAREVLADAGQLREIASFGQQGPHVLRQAAHDASRAAIGPHAKRVIPLEFQEIGRLIEHSRDLGVLYRHRADPSPKLGDPRCLIGRLALFGIDPDQMEASRR